MRLFTELFNRLDESNRTSEKLAALEWYFRTAPPADAAWALAFLAGRGPGRGISSTLLREFAAREAGLPPWIVAECHEAVGDLGETLALLLPQPAVPGEVPSLAEVAEGILLPMKNAAEEERLALLRRGWSFGTARERFVFHKLLLGGFRVGVSATLVARALAQVAGVEQSEMAHRLMGTWSPTAEEFLRLTAPPGTHAAPLSRPYPFFLASPLEGPPEALGPVAHWQVEWKWDGIRAQLLRRGGVVLLWSRGEELITDRFPELLAAAQALPEGTVLDGEVLAWQDGRPLPFQVLQSRIGRLRPSRAVLASAPAAFLAYDVLEHDGRDVREAPLGERRAWLEALVAAAGSPRLLASEPVVESDWESLARRREEARERGVEGLMLKRLASPYRSGRTRGDWWKWKINPLTIDAVLVAAQRGHGRRASLYTDYTFALWHEGELVPVAKAYSGLDDEEIARLDAWIRRHTLERFGPVRSVKPEHVFELAFEGVQHSTRHKSGVAVRFPRIARWRTDKPVAEADQLDALRALARVVPPPVREPKASRGKQKAADPARPATSEAQDLFGDLLPEG